MTKSYPLSNYLIQIPPGMNEDVFTKTYKETPVQCAFNHQEVIGGVEYIKRKGWVERNIDKCEYSITSFVGGGIALVNKSGSGWLFK